MQACVRLCIYVNACAVCVCACLRARVCVCARVRAVRACVHGKCGETLQMRPGYRCTDLQAPGVELQQEVVCAAGGEEQQARGAGGPETKAQHVPLGRLRRLEMHEAIPVEGGCRREGRRRES